MERRTQSLHLHLFSGVYDDKNNNHNNNSLPSRDVPRPSREFAHTQLHSARARAITDRVTGRRGFRGLFLYVCMVAKLALGIRSYNGGRVSSHAMT